jgi:hypothetical protein
LKICRDSILRFVRRYSAIRLSVSVEIDSTRRCEAAPASFASIAASIGGSSYWPLALETHSADTATTAIAVPARCMASTIPIVLALKVIMQLLLGPLWTRFD